MTEVFVDAGVKDAVCVPRGHWYYADIWHECRYAEVCLQLFIVII